MSQTLRCTSILVGFILTATQTWAGCTGALMQEVRSQLSNNGLNSRVVACSALPNPLGVYSLLTDTDGMHFVYLHHPEPGVLTINKNNRVVACRRFHLDSYRHLWETIPASTCWTHFNGDLK